MTHQAVARVGMDELHDRCRKAKRDAILLDHFLCQQSAWRGDPVAARRLARLDRWHHLIAMD